MTSSTRSGWSDIGTRNIAYTGSEMARFLEWLRLPNIGEGKDEMTKPSIDLQDLRDLIFILFGAVPLALAMGIGLALARRGPTEPSGLPVNISVSLS